MVAPIVQPYYAPVTPAPTTNPMAIASLVIALVGTPMCLVSPAAIPFGHIALSQIRRSGTDPHDAHAGPPSVSAVPQGGRGMAIAGLVIGYVTLSLWVIALIQIATTST